MEIVENLEKSDGDEIYDQNKENYVPLIDVHIPTHRKSFEIKKLDPRIIPFVHTKGIDFILNFSSVASQLEKFDIVLDLDNTLIAAFLEDSIDDLEKIPNKYEKISINGTSLIIIRRPGLETFLNEISKFANLILYTNAVRSYADKVLDLIDPYRIYFRDRVIACENETSSYSLKNLQEIISRLNYHINPDTTFIIDDQISV